MDVFGAERTVVNTSIVGWLGIGGHDTEWDRLTEAEAADAAAHVARLCQHFLTAASRLLEGLSPDGPVRP